MEQVEGAFKDLNRVLKEVWMHDEKEKKTTRGRRRSGLGEDKGEGEGVKGEVKDKEVEQEALLGLCGHSRARVLAALGLDGDAIESDDCSKWKEEQDKNEYMPGMGPAALVESIIALDIKFCELLSSINTLLFVAGASCPSFTSTASPSSPKSASAAADVLSHQKAELQKKAYIQALRALGQWRSLLETLRLRFEAV